MTILSFLLAAFAVANIVLLRLYFRERRWRRKLTVAARAHAYASGKLAQVATREQLAETLVSVHRELGP